MDVFISYARSSEPVAQRLAERLAAAGYRVWRDDQIPAHRPYAEVIEERLRQARCVVVLWSADAVRSQWVRAEADVARGEGKLVQARVDGATPPLPFDQIQHADLKGWKGEADHPGWRKIEDSVRALAGEAAPGPPAAAPRPSGRRLSPWLLGTLAAALLVLVAVGLWFGLRSHEASDAGAGQVAIQPLAADPANRDLAQAAQDQIMSRLNVVGVSPLDGKAQASRQAALQVDGRVQSEEGAVKARMRITQGRDGAVLWTGQFERRAGQASVLPDQIGAKVADMADCGMKSVARGVRMSASARTAYLRFCDLRREDTGSPETFDAARSVTEQAPEFAVGWSELAISAAFAQHALPPQQQAAVRAMAIAAADRAIKLDSNAAGAYLAHALLLPWRDWRERAQWLDRAIAAADRSDRTDASTIDAISSGQLRSMGRMAEGQALIRRAPGLDPNSPAKAVAPTRVLLMAGETAQAIRALEAAERIWPDNRYVVSERVLLTAVVDPRAALPLLANPASRPREFGEAGVSAWRAFVNAQVSESAPAKDEAAGRLLQALETNAIDPWIGVVALLVLDRTAELESYYRSIPPGAAAPEIGPLFSPQAAAYRHAPQFVALMRDLGLAQFWRTSGKWPDFCAEPGLPYRCADAFR